MPSAPRCPLRSRWVLGLMMLSIAAVALSDQSFIVGAEQPATVFSAGGGRLTGGRLVAETVVAENLIDVELRGGGVIMRPGFIPKKKLLRQPPTGGVDDTPAPGIAAATRLVGNRPNPFNPATTVRFDLGREGAVALRIYDVQGRLVRTLVDERRGAGEHDVAWDGRADGGQPLASGLYLLEMVTEGYRSQSKMVLTR